MNPNTTAAFPSLDAWKRTQEAREDTLKFLHKATLDDIKEQASRGKDSFILRLGGSEYEVERRGWWIFYKLTPKGRLKRLIEMFEADGFSVSVDHENSFLCISWDISE